MRLFAGPYYGEFGHEVLGTGLLRASARRYAEVIVCSRASRRALYADIATEFRPHAIDCIGKANRATDETAPSPNIVESYIEKGCDHFLMPDCGYPPTEARIRTDGIYRAFGTEKPKWRGALVFHARNRPHQTDRNWPMKDWSRLARWALGQGIAKRIVCVGTREQARLIEGCEDMRGSPLATQMDIAASALCAVGPSSGWMHLASLCRCPHLTWVGGKEHVYVRRRYVDRWNPLRTPARVLPERTWQPEFGAVRDALADFVKEAA